jgi:E3 ubiquitin-protein ligase SHPRH
MATDGPASKKRKLSHDDVDQDDSQYTVIARWKFEVVQPQGKQKALPINEEITLKSVHLVEQSMRLSMNKSHGPVWSVEAVSATSQALYDSVQNAASLPSHFKSTPARTLHVCHRASLCAKDIEVTGTLSLTVEILWNNTTSIFESMNDRSLAMLRTYLPSTDSESDSPSLEPWQPADFYNNVHRPSTSTPVVDGWTPPGFSTALYPFQRRTLQWMLQREGVAVDNNGTIAPSMSPTTQPLPHGFVQTRDLNGGVQYVNHALGVLSSNYNEVVKTFAAPCGGLLAEEMGLGKTLAVVGTVCAHKRPSQQSPWPTSDRRASGATLIITPPVLLEQWKEEIARHAGSLSVITYEGVKSRTPARIDQLIDDLASSDIVLTTYNVISREVHYVKEKPDRKLRHAPRNDAPKSPLTEISWWRVCLDEAQMVESGVSNAAVVARLVPREIGWAVTGTPLRKSHRDLYGIMVFLRYQPWAYSTKVWDRLLQYHRPLFRSMIKEIALRHTKDFVRDDLRLPPQNRHTITMPFTAVEEQHYENLFEECCELIGIRADGTPRSDQWDPEDPLVIEKMRTWLSRLRQTCLHPEVGARNRRALGRGGGPLRTVAQVLDVMIDQLEGNLRTEQRSLLMSRIRRGQMLENAKSTDEALKLWSEAFEESTSIVKECRSRLEEEVKLRSQEKAARRIEEESQPDKSGISDDSEEEEEQTDANILTYRQRLRSALEVQHICIFFMGSAYYQLKTKEANTEADETNIEADKTNIKADKTNIEADETKTEANSPVFHALEKQETEAYETAKKIRGELLTEVLQKANKLIQSVRRKGESQIPAALTNLKTHEEYSGIESRKYVEKLDAFCEAINKQAQYFQNLRLKMIENLKKALIDDDAGVELVGDEYEISTKHQDEMYVYMEALRMLFADRTEAVTGLENQLIKHEARNFWRSAKENQGPAPELMLELLQVRLQNRIDINKKGSLRGIVSEVRSLVSTLEAQEATGSTRARAELTVAESLLKHVQGMATSMSKTLPALEQEVNLFKDTMNSRLDYYRALQKISDTVAPYEEDKAGQPLDQAKFDDTLRGEHSVSDKISVMLAKRRYLLNLKDESTATAKRTCIICQSDFENGTLTVCGHTFCKECIQLWWMSHHNCPVCKKHLSRSDFHDITYKPSEMAVQAETPAPGSESPSSDDAQQTGNQSIYSDISTRTLEGIKTIDLNGPSFGSKVDMLMRHIIWLRDHDYAAKSIIFSQYRDFLDVLRRAFTAHNISYAAFEDKNGIQKFKATAGIECFLLHAKAHSAGLNLVCANHVFLCEPLLATAVELQAIARVHRIGQHRPTTVWMYIIGGTVEESIYEMSVARRLEHIKRNVKLSKGKESAASTATSGTTTPKLLGENVIEMANSLELQDADLKKLLTTGKTGGEYVHKEDLWRCLFGKSRLRENVMAADRAPADGEIGRHLRAEAADARANDAC